MDASVDVEPESAEDLPRNLEYLLDTLPQLAAQRLSGRPKNPEISTAAVDRGGVQ